MPLSRYEIRSEYSLANPDLYRAAFKDDPQGLLEGVAMAGLVGIIRQLGDMAEFAAEVFQDLHEEVVATAARSHRLLVKVQQLETEIPLIQKMMLTENNHKKFAHNPGVDWHTHIHNDQNHFTQGDLPRFVRYAYEDCRSPPRLFLLDRFNDDGAGACLKKITDPSYFKMEWASSELMKAEKDQRDQQARRLKKKGQQQGDADVRGESHAQCTQPRVHSEPAETKSPVSPSIRSTASDTSLGSRESDVHLSYEEDRSNMAGHGLEAKDALLTSLGFRESGVHLSYKEDSSNMAGHGLEAKDALLNADPALSAIYSPQNGFVPKAGSEVALSNGLDAEGANDETDHFVDALATIDSEVDSDFEMKTRDVTDDARGVELKEVEVPVVEVNQGASASLLEDNKGEVGLEQDLSSTHQTGKETIESEDIEHAKYVDNSLVEVVKQEKISFDTSVGALKGPINDDGCLPYCEPGEVTSVSSMGGLARLVSTTPDVSVDPDEKDGDPPVASQEQSDVDLQIESSLAASKMPSGPATANEGAPDSAYYTQSSPLSTRRRRWQSNEVFKKEFLVSALRRTTFDDSESEQSESPNRLLSTHSSPDSIGVRPMNWAMGLSRFYDTDDEMDGAQVSSPSSSVSSSTLSSPRPSTLATTIFNSTWKSKPPASLQAQGIVDLSPSPKSPGMGTMPSKPSPSVSSQPPSHPSTSMLSPDLEHPQDSINICHPEKCDAEVSVQSLDMDDQEICPPPPPLPPLAWRMSRRSVRSSRVNPPKGATCSDTTPSNKAVCHAGSPFSIDVSTHSSAVPTVRRGSSSGLNEPPPTSTSPTSIPVPTKLTMDPEKLDMSPRTSSLGVQVVPSRSDDLLHVSGCAESSSWHDCLSFASDRDQNPASETQRGNVDEEITSKPSENEASNGGTNVYSVEGFAGQERVAKSHGSKLNSQHSVVAESASLSSKSFKTVMKDARPMDFERDYPSRQASGSQDWNRIKQRSKWALTPSTASSDDREFLLEQIRSKSFSLQHTKPVKQLALRPATNISVAAILEKANSIRQAFADSDEDDDS